MEKPTLLRLEIAARIIAAMSARDSFDAGQATPQQRAKLTLIDADALIEESKRSPHADAMHNELLQILKDVMKFVNYVLYGSAEGKR